MRNLSPILFCFIIHSLNAQPFIDLVNIKYSNSPDAGLIRRNNRAATFHYFSINLNLPVIIGKDSSAIVFSPLAETWNMNINASPLTPDQYQSVVLQTSWIKPLSTKWTMTISAIPRWNGYNGHWFNNNFQMGGALLAAYKKTSTLKYKFGIYYNSEFSGAFFVPLLGIDWHLNSKNNIFGILPGNLTWEHKALPQLYYGGVFRSITNSYQSGFINNNAYFMRIDDNQLSIYSDLYIAKKIVIILEAGHSVLRQIRLSDKNGEQKYFYKDKINDNLLFRAALAYRIRI